MANDFIIRNSAVVLGNLRTQGAFIDSANSSGTQSYVLTSTGTSSLWVSATANLGFTPENIANKQNNLNYDGTGVKYTTVDSINNFQTNVLKFSARTGLISKKDDFDMTAPNLNNILIATVSQAIFWNELFTPNIAPSSTLKSFNTKTYPLSQLITATGGNINIDPIVSDGIYIRWLGYDINGNVYSSLNSFTTNDDILQLGFCTVLKAGPTVSFLGGTALGGRNVAPIPNMAANTDYDRIVSNSTNVKISGNPTASFSLVGGTITGISINWKSSLNPGNVNPIDIVTILDYNGNQPFISLTPLSLSQSTPQNIHTSWTELEEGIALNNSFFNKTTGLRDTLGTGNASIKRVLIGPKGGIYLQEGEHNSPNEYANLADAKSDIFNINFSDAVLPPGITIEIARIAFVKGVLNLTDPNISYIVNTSNGTSGGNINVSPVNDASNVTKGILKLAGDLGGTADLPTTPTALHITGNESWTGIKSATNSGVSNINGIKLTNTGSSGTDVLNITNTSSGRGITLTNNSSGSGLITFNTSSGIGHYMLNSSTGQGVILDSSTASNGDLLQFRKNASATTKVDHLGVITTSPTVNASTIGRGMYINPTVNATNNADTLVWLDINGAFNNGTFSSVTQLAARFGSNIGPSVDNLYTNGTSVSNWARVRTRVIESTTGTLDFAQNGNVYGRLYTTGNLTLQNGGTFTDNGVDRLQVTGSILATQPITTNFRLIINSNISSGINDNSGVSLQVVARTITNNSAGTGSTTLHYSNNSLATSTFAATNTGVTYTNSSSLFIAGSPIAGTNITITNPWSLYVNSGKSYFGGDLRINSGNLELKNTTSAIYFTAADDSKRNYIQGEHDSTAPDDFIEIGSHFGSIKLSSGVSTATTTRMQMFNNGNFIFQNGGTFSDTGEKIQVTGTTKHVGDVNIKATTTDTSYTGIGIGDMIFGKRGSGTTPMLATRTNSTVNTGFFNLAIQNADVIRTNEADFTFRTGVEVAGAIQSLTQTGIAVAFQNANTNLFTISRQGTLNITTVPTTSAGTYDIITRNTSTGVIEKILSSSIALDANVIHKTGDETKTGTLTVNSIIKATASSTNILLAGGGDIPQSTFASASTAHNPVTIGTANGLSLATQVLSLSAANTSTTGALTSTDWNSFNNRLPLTGGVMSGNILGSINSTLLGNFYIDTHPEASTFTLIPFVNNDIAHLTEKGGSASSSAGSISTGSPLFNGSPNYAQYNTTGWTSSYPSGFVIDINFHKTFYYGSQVGISFGSPSWRATAFQIEMFNGTTYSTVYATASNSRNYANVSVDGGATGFTKMRFRFTAYPTDFRIAQIWLINYSSLGYKEVMLGLDGGTLYGNLTAPRFISTITTGTAPFQVASQTVVTNLNADSIDGLHSNSIVYGLANSATNNGRFDANTFTKSGFYWAGSGSSNVPTTGGLFVLAHDTLGPFRKNVLYDDTGDSWTRQETGTANVWSSWRKLLDSTNYINYTPGLTGTGANGTWNINITGSAPWANITGKPTTISGYGITDTILQPLTGYVSNPGTVSGTDSILSSIQKLNGNIGLKQATLSGTGIVKSTTGVISYITDNSTNWNTAYTERNQWDGGTTGLVASTGRTSLGASTLGSNLFTTTNPSAVTFLRVNADNSVSWLDAPTFKAAIGAINITPSPLTKVDDTNVTLTLGGTPSTALLQSVSLTLGWTGTLADSRISSAANWNTAYNERNRWDGGATGLVAATGRTSLGASTVGGNIFISPNPSAITFLRANADNTISWLDASTFRTAIGASSVTPSALTKTDDTNVTLTLSGTSSSALLTPVNLTLGWTGTLADSRISSATNWNTAYNERNRWDGGATGLVAATGRTSLGASTIGSNIFTSTNPSAITFLRANADNTASWLDASTFRTAIGALASSSYTAADILSKLITVDGTGSGLDADLLDGINSGSFLRKDLASDTFGNTITGQNITFNFADPGDGFSSGFNFVKASDGAGLSVTSHVSDSTLYEFYMSDNPDANDYFSWRFTDWQGNNGLWQPLYIGAMENRFIAKNNRFYGDILQQTSNFYTTRNNTGVNANRNINVINNLTQLKINGSGTNSIASLNVSGYTGTSGSSFWIRITGTGSTFDWGYGDATAGTAVQTGMAVNTTPVALSNGISVSFTALTGDVIGDRYQCRVYKIGTNTFGPSLVTGNLTATQLSSNVATGTAPITVSSTTLVTNLNADLLDGFHASSFQTSLSGTGIVKSTAGVISYITDNSTNWNTAYTERNRWDGGATGLVAATGRTSLGASTLGSNLFTTSNPSALTFLRVNADNSVSWLDAAAFRTAIGVGASTLTGTVNRLGKFNSGGNSVIDSTVTDNGTNVQIITSDARLLGGDTTGRLIVSNSSTTAYIELDGSANTTVNKVSLVSTSGTIALNTASVERLTVLNGGNIGINQTNPSQKLDVTGYIRATSGFVGNGGLILYGDNSSTNQLFVATNGNTSIGSSNVTNYSNYITLTIGDNSASKVGLIKLRSNYNVGDGAEIYQDASGTLVFNVNSTSGAIWVRSNGNVGIGTGGVTTDKLTVVGSILSSGNRQVRIDGGSGFITIKGDAGGWANGYYFRGSANADLGGFGALGGVDTLDYYYIGPAYNNPVASFKIANGVGVGTNNPLTGGSGAKWLTLEGTTSYGGGVISSINGTAKTYFYYDSGYGRIQTADGFKLVVNNTTEAVTVASNGGVGIGIVSPGEKLHVEAGNIVVSNTYPYLRLFSGSWSSNSYIQGGVTYNGGSGGNFLAFLNPSGKGFSLSIGNGANFIVNTNGNVLIGNSNDVSKGSLQVTGAIYSSGGLRYTQPIQIGSQDLNNITDAGFYAGSAMTNAPDAGWFFVTVEGHSDTTWLHQTATSYGAGNTANRIYTRVKSGGPWGSWQEIVKYGDTQTRVKELIITDTNGVDKYKIVYNPTTDSLDTIKL